MENHCVYLLIFETGKIYVGRSANLDKRISAHLTQLNTGRHHNFLVASEWEKCRAFTVTKIDVGTIERAIEFEQFYIDKFRELGVVLNIGAATNGGDNITNHPNKAVLIASRAAALLEWSRNCDPSARYRPTGERNPMWGRTHTAEARQKMSQANLGISRNKGIKRSDETKLKLSLIASQRVGAKNPFYGKTHSEKTRKLLSDKGKGKLPSNCVKISIDGVIYQSLGEASRITGIPVVTIRWRVLSKNKRFDNYRSVAAE